MNEIFSRMKTLLERAGFSFDEGGISYAELCAYAKGLSLVKELLDTAESILLLNCEDKSLLTGYADMLRLDSERYSAASLKEEIKRRLALPFSFSSYSSADAEYASVSSGEYALTERMCVVMGAGLGDLKEAGKFLEAYSPFCAQRLYSGEGERLNFDMWDSIACTFNAYDSLRLTFDFLDTLRSDIFEQH